MNKIDLSKLYKSRVEAPKTGAYATFNTDGDDNKKSSIVSQALSTPKVKLSKSRLLDESYRKRGIYYNIYDDQKDYDRQRADKQKWYDQLANATIQTVSNEIILGSIAGFSNIADWGVNLFSSEPNDYVNSFTKNIEELQDYIRNAAPIYQRNPEEAFQLGDSGWWFNNAISIASTVSLLIPSMAAMKTASAIGKIGNIGKKTSRALAHLNPTRLSNNISKTRAVAAGSRNIRNATDLTIGALASRIGEGYLEAREVWKTSKDDVYSKMSTWNKNEWDTFFQNNPNLESKYKNANGTIDINGLSNYIAGESADKTFNDDMKLLALDMLQLKGLNKMTRIGLPKSKSTPTSAKTYIHQQNALKRLADEPEENMIKNTFLNRRKADWQMIKNKKWESLLDNPITLTADKLAFLQLSEGFEEGFQGIMTEKGKEVAKKYLDSDFRERDLLTYINDPHILEQAVWGTLGGMAFQTVGKYTNKISDYLTNKRTDTNINFTWSLSAEEKIKKDEIDRRKQRLDIFKRNIDLINNGYDPFSPQFDANGVPLSNDDGSTKYNTIKGNSLEEIENAKKVYKEQVVDDFISEITMDSIDAGNYHLLRDYLSSKEFNEYLKKNNLETVDDIEMNKKVLNTMDNVYNYYIDNISNLIDAGEDSNDGANPFVAKLAARDILRKQLLRDSLNKKIQDNNKLLNKYSDSDYRELINKSKEFYNYYYTLNKLLELSQKQQEYEKLYNDGEISQQAYNKYYKDIKNKIKKLNEDNFINYNQPISKILLDVSNEVNKLQNEYDFSKLLKEDTNLISESEYLTVESNYLNSEIPTFNNEFKESYESVAKTIDKYTKKRYDKAVDRIINWLSKQEDLDVAKQQLYENNINDKSLYDDLLLLKLGHEDYKAYTKDIDDFIKSEKEKRTKEKNESNNIIINGDNTILNNEQNQNISENLNNDEDIINKERRFKLLEKYIKINKYFKNRIKDILNDKKINNKLLIENLKIAKDIIEDNNKYKFNLVSDEFINNYNALTEYINSGKLNLTDSPSTGEIVQDDTILEEEIDEINNVQDIVYEQPEESELLDNYDELIYKNYNSFIENRDYDNFVKNITESSFNEEINKFKTFLISQDIPEYIINKLARKIIIRKLTLYNRVKRTNVEYAKLKNLLEDIKYERLSSLSNIEGNEVNEEINLIIDEIIQTYLKDNNSIKNNKPYIDLKRFFGYLFNDGVLLTYNGDILAALYNQLMNFVENNKDNYVFANKAVYKMYKKNPELFYLELLKEQYEDSLAEDLFHINISNGLKERGSNILKPEEEEWIKSLPSDVKIKIDYTRDKYGYPVSISFKIGNKEIGYISPVQANSKNTGFFIDSITQGFKTYVNKTDNGIESNIDELFEFILSEDGIEIYNYLKDKFLNPKLETINLIDKIEEYGIDINSIYKFSVKDEIQKNSQLIKSINKILFYNKYEISKEARLASIESWKQRVYKNYEITYNIIQQGIINGNENRDITLSMLGGAKLNILPDSNIDIKDLDFDYTKNPIIVARNENNLESEIDNNKYSNIGFPVGSMGFMVDSVEDKPILALFTEVNNLNIKENLGQAVISELNNLFEDFKNNKIDLDELYKSLEQLISSNPNSLFRGIDVIKFNKPDKGKNNRAIFIRLSEKQSIRIYDQKNGEKVRNIIFNNKNYNKFEELSKIIASNLKFNRTFYYIKNKNNSDITEKANKYLQKKNGKILLSIGGKELIYENFGDFVIKNNAFKTNIKKQKGSFISYPDGITGIYLNIGEPKRSPVKGNTLSDVLLHISSKDSKGKSKDKTLINTEEVLEMMNYTKNEIDLLLGKTTGVPLMPLDFYYDSSINTSDAEFNKVSKLIKLTKRGLDNTIKNPANFKRFLMHEQIHKQFNSLSKNERERLLKNLSVIYNDFVKYLSNDNSAKAERIKVWIKDNKFSISEYTDNAFVNNKFTKEKKEQIFLEEFLVESLTQQGLMNYLNNAILKNENINIENINQGKSLFQRIIDFILKLFGKSRDYINKNSILAKEYLLLGNVQSNTLFDILDKKIEDNNIENKIEDSEIKTEDDNKNTEYENKLKELLENSIQQSNKITEEEDEEDIDIDDLYSKTTNIPNINNVSNHDNSVKVVSMDKYLSRFPHRDRSLISDNLDAGNISFRCR